MPDISKPPVPNKDKRRRLGTTHLTAAMLMLSAGLLAVGIVALPDGPAAADANRNEANQAVNADPVQAAISEALDLLESQVISLDLPFEPGVAFSVVTAADAILDGHPVTLDLWPYSQRAPGFRAMAQLDDGSLVEIDTGPERTMRGTIMEIPGSKVAASLLDDGLHAMIILPGEADLLWIEPVAMHVAGDVDPAAHVVYASGDVACGQGVCGVTDQVIHPPSLRGQEGGGSGGIAGLVCETVKIGIDVDFPFVQIWSGQTNALNRVNNVMNNTNAIYESQVGIIHLISEIIVRTSSASNPYTCSTGSGSANNLLTQFANVWSTVPESSIDRDVAHLFTGCTGINAAGIAQLGGANITGGFNAGVCRPGHYGLATHQGSLACQTHVTAHELGHNWSAQHCDGTAGCSGTIMPAFFPPCSTTFNDFSKNQILNHKNSSHWGACTVPCDADPPANNTCMTATNVPIGSTSFTNFAATTDGPDEPQCNFPGSATIESDVWFRHTATCTGTLFVLLCNSSSSFDTTLAVYGSTCPTEPGTAIVCNKDHCGSQSGVTLPVTEGQLVRIRVGGHNGQYGDGVLTVVCSADPDPPACPADLTGDGNVGVADLLALLSQWGPCPSGCDADLTGDSNVGVADLLELLSQWGACPE